MKTLRKIDIESMERELSVLQHPEKIVGGFFAQCTNDVEGGTLDEVVVIGHRPDSPAGGGGTSFGCTTDAFGFGGGDGTGWGNAIGGGIWAPISSSWMGYLSNYVANTPDSAYVERVVYVLENGTAVAYQDSAATRIETNIPFSYSTVNGVVRDSTIYLLSAIYNSGSQYRSPIDSVIHTHINNPNPSSQDSTSRLSGVNNSVLYEGTLTPY